MGGAGQSAVQWQRPATEHAHSRRLRRCRDDAAEPGSGNLLSLPRSRTMNLLPFRALPFLYSGHVGRSPASDIAMPIAIWQLPSTWLDAR